MLPSFECQDLAADKSETDIRNILYLIYYVLLLVSPLSHVSDCCTSILYCDVIARLIKMEAGKAVSYMRLIALSVRLLIRWKDVTLLF